jgi:hypothetical protein
MDEAKAPESLPEVDPVAVAPLDGLANFRESVQHCPRCEKPHLVGLHFARLSNPVLGVNGVVEFTHWTICPETGEPLLTRVSRGSLS